mmetsp:Transcript_10324/g.26212  ORF Transcript_10324/g.26212 Transcript_10324/m.26212 type:complete len:268 (-) Transcript_10324:818-1621(-)
MRDRKRRGSAIEWLDDIRVENRVNQATPEAKVPKSRTNVCRRSKFRSNPSVAHSLRVAAEVRRRSFVGACGAVGGIEQCAHSHLRGQHAAFHRRVRPLDLRHVQQSRGTSENRAAGKVQILWQTLPSTLVERARAVLKACSILEQRLDARVHLPFLECVVWIEVWVTVVQPHDESKRDKRVVSLGGSHVIQERASVHVARQRVPHRVLAVARIVLFLGHAPHFLESQRIRLRLRHPAHRKLFHDELAQRASAPFREQRRARRHLHAS